MSFLQDERRKEFGHLVNTFMVPWKGCDTEHATSAMRFIIAALGLWPCFVGAHGSHSQEDAVNPADDWALYHMQEEHRAWMLTC